MSIATVRRDAMQQRSLISRRWALGSAILTGLLIVGLMTTALAPLAAANEVLTWNETAVKVSTAGGQNNIHVTRTLAMVQGAVHDALNAIKALSNKP